MIGYFIALLYSYSKETYRIHSGKKGYDCVIKQIFFRNSSILQNMLQVIMFNINLLFHCTLNTIFFFIII